MHTSVNGSSATDSPTPIAQALACYADIRSNNRKGADRELVRPKFKGLVLDVIPAASVRRTAEHTYECFIGEHPISWGSCGTGQHSAADKAWRCLADYADSPEYAAAEATGVFK